MHRHRRWLVNRQEIPVLIEWGQRKIHLFWTGTVRGKRKLYLVASLQNLSYRRMDAIDCNSQRFLLEIGQKPGGYPAKMAQKPL